MPEGPAGAPRLTNIGPLSRSTKDEIKSFWDECPQSGKPNEICKELKFTAIAVLEGQDFFARCDTLSKINSGECGTVARRVFSQVGGVRVMEVGNGEHVWLEHNGIHYDVEVPTGVEDPIDLPFFDRIPPNFVLDSARMAAETEGREPPETIDDTIKDVTDEYK